MDVKSENRDVNLSVSLHYPGEEDSCRSEPKDETKLQLLAIEPSTNLSSLASKILQKLYQEGKVEGKEILKASNVKVLIQVRPTWKPLPLSSFAYKQSESELTLEKVFGGFLHVDDNQMIVHLHLCNANVWSDQSVRDVVKKLLENYSQTQLERLNCPLSQGMLSQISRDQYYCKVSAEKIRLFGLWYDAMMTAKHDNDDEDADEPAKRPTLGPRGKKIVFSTAEELPLLKAWFDSQTHPSSQEMVKFAQELNETEFRKSAGREKVDFRHVNNWFKNERARMRKIGLVDSMVVSQVRFRTEYPETGDEEKEETGN